ncbi:SpoIID/LytB domain-containing protein [Paenibacillus cymbidii]|uniref:SpoIID/LytB domain-containing protein n=1 Tax=Paenibacillus cymbidii TaxID=1639034 RepID=UPI0010817550|nr:SpoIID/LytB domain-containing protein [Paenibacillus cymbidii]
MNLTMRRKMLTALLCVGVWSAGYGAGAAEAADAAPKDKAATPATEAASGNGATPVNAANPPVTDAAVPKEDSIRVALYLDTKEYSRTVPSVTFTAPAGLRAGFGAPGAGSAVLATTDGKPLRASLDQFRVLLLETGDAAQAQKLADKLDGAVVWKTSKAGKDVYRVLAGPYATAESAAAAKETLAKTTGLPASSFAVKGALRLSAGDYASEPEAAAQLAAVAKAGFDAAIAVQGSDAGKIGYAVWIGDEADPAQLAALQQQATKALPGVALQPADTKAPYLLLRSDAADGAEPVTHAAINPAAGARMWVAPQAGKLTVREKSGRTYRGFAELSQLNGKLAVINELPLEQYLYAVVSSEMSTGWPLEALKAQAVAARTYAVRKNMAYTVADVTDTTLDQAYEGKEFDDVVKAVDATRGEIIVDAAGKPIEALFSSNAGGMTADNAEAWRGKAPYFRAGASPDDGDAAGRLNWLRVAMADGRLGYVRSDLLRDTGQRNPLGLTVYTATEKGVNVREAPYTWDNAANPGFAQLNPGDAVVAIGQEKESSSYNWLSVPLRGSELLASLNKQLSAPLAGPLTSLQVASRGPSGRVTLLRANGKDAAVTYPDSYRSALGGLRSTLFEIEETGRYTILGADGRTTSHPETTAAPVIASAFGAATTGGKSTAGNMLVLGSGGTLRAVTAEPQFIFRGKGFGHGLGMSQWGARGYAELGYDYRYILQNYFAGTTIVKP